MAHLGMLSSLASVAAELVAWVIAPAKCAACDERVSRLAAFCAACASTAQRVDGRDAHDIAGFVYGGAVQTAIARFKYERRPDLARPLGDLLWRAVEPHAAALREAIVVPVPLHPVRLAERGYNQSALLAARIATRLGCPLLPMALSRARNTPRQATLDRDARASNVIGAFQARQPRRIEGRHILLVDDVRTTGFTLQACQSAIVAVGAGPVTIAVLARAP